MNAMLPAHLSETLNNLGDAARTLAEEVRQDQQQRAQHDAAAATAMRRNQRRTIALLAFVAILVAGLAVLSIANRRLGMANSALNRQNAQIVEQIRSCTTEGQPCYEQSRQRTGDVSRAIMLAGIHAELCIRDHPDASGTQIEKCVLDRVRADAERSEPSPSGLGPDGKPIPTPSSWPAPSATS